MAIEAAENTLTAPAQNSLRTSALPDDGLMAAKPMEIAFREAWRQALEKVSMMRFMRFPDLEAEGLMPPNGRSITKALDLINSLMAAGSFPPPMRVSPSGEGGIVFERWDAEKNSERIEITGSGDAELTLFQKAKLVSRVPIH